MNVVAARPMTVEEFLAWEERQDLRYEFDGVRPVAMTGGTRAHNIISGNVFAQLLVHLRGAPCRPYTADMKMRVGGRVRYPDVLVACGPAAMTDTVETAPVVVFEVLSPSTAGTDRIVDLAEYRGSDSIQRYVMLEQSRMAATVIARATARDGGEVWTHDLLTTPDALLRMPEIGAELRLGDVYEGVVLSDPDAEEVAP